MTLLANNVTQRVMRTRARNLLLQFAMAAGLLSCASSTLKDQVSADRSVDEVMIELARRLNVEPGTKIGVFPFQERGRGPTEAGEYLADKLMAKLSKRGDVVLIDRSPLLQQAFREVCRSADGLIKDEDAISIGNQEGAQVVVVATLTPIGDHFDLVVKALDTESGRALDVEEAQLSDAMLPGSLLGKQLPQLELTCATAEPNSTPQETAEPLMVTSTVVQSKGLNFFHQRPGISVLLTIRRARPGPLGVVFKHAPANVRADLIARDALGTRYKAEGCAPVSSLRWDDQPEAIVHDGIMQYGTQFGPSQQERVLECYLMADSHTKPADCISSMEGTLVVAYLGVDQKKSIQAIPFGTLESTPIAPATQASCRK